MRKITIILILLSSIRVFSQIEKIKVKKQDTVVYTVVDQAAEFPGGITALQQFVNSNIQYPPEYAQNSFQGSCYIKFTITSLGNIEKITVVKGVPEHPGFDLEAIRVVELMPKWKPAYIKSQPVNSYFTLPIKFKIE